MLWRGHRSAGQGSSRLRGTVAPLEGARRAGALHRCRPSAGLVAGTGQDAGEGAQRGHRPRDRGPEEEGEGGARQGSRGRGGEGPATPGSHGQPQPAHPGSHQHSATAEGRPVVLLQPDGREPGKTAVPEAMGQARERGQLAAAEPDRGQSGCRYFTFVARRRHGRTTQRQHGYRSPLGDSRGGHGQRLRSYRHAGQRPAQPRILPGSDSLHRGAGTGEQRHHHGRTLQLGRHLQGQARQPASFRKATATAHHPVSRLRADGPGLVSPLPVIFAHGRPHHGSQLPGPPTGRPPGERVDHPAERPLL